MARENAQQRAEARRRQILDVARERADAEGWSAVTTRLLADAIGYTQPVLYGHFSGGKAEIMVVIALEGFVELAERCRRALAGTGDGGAVEAVANAYLDFGRDHPAVYEAMFQQPLSVAFASEDTPRELREAFDVLCRAIGDDEGGAAAEVFWGALHGICLLEGTGRMRPEHRASRIAELSVRF